jgi:hypothetical protein
MLRVPRRVPGGLPSETGDPPATSSARGLARHGSVFFLVGAGDAVTEGLKSSTAGDMKTGSAPTPTVHSSRLLAQAVVL